MKKLEQKKLTGKLILIMPYFRYFTSPIDSQMLDVSLLKLCVS